MTYFINAWADPMTGGGGFAVFDEFGTSIERREFKRHLTRKEGELLAFLRAASAVRNGARIVTETKNTVAWVISGDPKGRPDLKPYAQRARRLVAQKALQVSWKARKPARQRIVEGASE